MPFLYSCGGSKNNDPYSKEDEIEMRYREIDEYNHLIREAKDRLDCGDENAINQDVSEFVGNDVKQRDLDKMNINRYEEEIERRKNRIDQLRDE